MDERYDIAIIGSGPAGLSAALNAKIRNKSFILFGNKDLSNKIVKAHKIDNYLGLYGKSGMELKENFIQHLEAMDIKITEEKINNIYPMGDYYSLLVNDKVYEASSIILATGVNFGKSIPGEEEYLGKGVSYCATCDAPLYKGKAVTVIAYSKHEEAEANYLAGIASKVYYIPMYKDKVEVNDSIQVIHDVPSEIKGDQFVGKLVLKKQEIVTDGIFILRDSISPKQLIPGLKLNNNHVDVDRNMKTNLDGCFAAGDIVGTPYQYIKAAGEGNIASLAAVTYLDKKSKGMVLNEVG